MVLTAVALAPPATITAPASTPITPPVGVNVYVVSGIERSLPLQTVFRGAMPFLLALAVACALLMVFPQLATWLPAALE